MPAQGERQGSPGTHKTPLAVGRLVQVHAAFMLYRCILVNIKGYKGGRGRHAASGIQEGAVHTTSAEEGVVSQFGCRAVD